MPHQCLQRGSRTVAGAFKNAADAPETKECLYEGNCVAFKGHPANQIFAVCMWLMHWRALKSEPSGRLVPGIPSSIQNYARLASGDIYSIALTNCGLSHKCTQSHNAVSATDESYHRQCIRNVDRK